MQACSVEQYQRPIGAHVLGTEEVDQSDIEEDDYYQPSDMENGIVERSMKRHMIRKVRFSCRMPMDR